MGGLDRGISRRLFIESLVISGLQYNNRGLIVKPLRGYDLEIGGRLSCRAHDRRSTVGQALIDSMRPVVKRKFRHVLTGGN